MNLVVNMLSILSGLLLIAGLVFFLAGSVGLLRFTDSFSRLHAVTKADSLGLGLVVLGLALQASWRESLLMLLIWFLVMASGAVSCQLLARFSKEHTIENGTVDSKQSEGSD